MSEVKRYNTALLGADIPVSVVDVRDYVALEAARDQYRDLSIKYGDKLSEVLKERDAALAELAALKGGREPFIYATLLNGLAQRQGSKSHCQEWADAWNATDSCAENIGRAEVIPLYTAPPSQASAWVPEGYTAVLTETLEWLLGERGEFVCHPTEYFRGKPTPYFWRKDLRAAMLAAAPTPGEGKCG